MNEQLRQPEQAQPAAPDCQAMAAAIAEQTIQITTVPCPAALQEQRSARQDEAQNLLNSYSEDELAAQATRITGRNRRDFPLAA